MSKDGQAENNHADLDRGELLFRVRELEVENKTLRDGKKQQREEIQKRTDKITFLQNELINANGVIGKQREEINKLKANTELKDELIGAKAVIKYLESKITIRSDY